MKNFRTAVLVLALAVVAVACKKEFDTPPERILPVGSVLTIAELKALYTGTRVRFTEPKSVFAVVTADETDGNFYKTISVQDRTGGLTLRLQNSGGLYIGDSIRIYLPGTVLAPYRGLMQLDSIDVDNNIVKQATLVNVAPIDVELTDLTLEAMDTLQSRLIRVNNVEFATAEVVSGTWADAVNQSSVSRTLEDCALNTVILRTSGFANYAGNPLPTGKGSIICIAGVYDTDVQLTNRSMTGVNMNGPRCPGQELPFFSKNFADQNLTSGGWTQHALIGTTIWGVQDLGSSGNFYAYINNFQQGASENWYISPAIDITSLSTPKLSFRNACRFTGPLLEVLVSTTYDGTSAPNLPDWTPLSPALDTNAAQYVWTESGLLDISAFSSSNFRVAFRYLGDNGNGRGWEIDDIKIVQ